MNIIVEQTETMVGKAIDRVLAKPLKEYSKNLHQRPLFINGHVVEDETKISGFLKLRPDENNWEVSFLDVMSPSMISGGQALASKNLLTVDSATDEIKGFLTLKGIIVLKVFIRVHSTSDDLKKVSTIPYQLVLIHHYLVIDKRLPRHSWPEDQPVPR